MTSLLDLTLHVGKFFRERWLIALAPAGPEASKASGGEVF